MNKKSVYTDEPMGDVEVVADFLPSPAELAFKGDGLKVTLAMYFTPYVFKSIILQ